MGGQGRSTLHLDHPADLPSFPREEGKEVSGGFSPLYLWVRALG